MPQMSQSALKLLIAKMARERGLNPADALAVAHIESSINPESNRNRSTQYKGLYQIGTDEWNRYGNGRNIYDPTANSDAFFTLWSENQKGLSKKLGRDVSPGEVYLAHQQGVTGASALINNADKNVFDVLRPLYKSDAFTRKVITGNGGSLDMTAGDFANKWINKQSTLAKQYANFWPNTVDEAPASQIAQTQPQIFGTQSTPAAPTVSLLGSNKNINLSNTAPPSIFGTQSTPAMPPPVQTANVATTAGGAQYGPPKADFQKFQLGKAQGSLMNGLGLLAAGMQQAQPIQLMAPSVHRPDPRWQGFQLGLLG